MRNNAYIMDAVETFKAIGEETRLRLLGVLVEAGCELCGCELIDVLEKPQYAISRHLGGLVGAGLLTERREGRNIFYALNADCAERRRIFATVAALPWADEATMTADRARLEARLARREGGCCTQQ